MSKDDWYDPEKKLPEDGVEVLVIARTETAESIQLLGMFEPDVGWFLTDVDDTLFTIKAWAYTPEWPEWVMKGGAA